MMKILLLCAAVLMFSTMLYAAPYEAPQQKVYCTIMFDYLGTPDEAEAMANWLMETFGTHVVAQFLGQPMVIYCEAPGKCMVLPGDIQVVPPEEEKTDI